MPVFNNALAGAAGSGGAAAGYKIERSLRFEPEDTSYLTKTFSSAGNRKTYTFSCWVKIASLGAEKNLLYADNTWLRFENTDHIYFWHSGGNLYTSAQFRDPSAWYHVVLAVDTTQATASNRVKIYVNGVNQALGGGYPSQNAEGGHNNAAAHNIGRQHTNNNLFNGYMAEVHFVDGQQLAATDFGEFDATTGAWNPIEFTGSHNTAAVGLGGVTWSSYVSGPVNSTKPLSNCFGGTIGSGYQQGTTATAGNALTLNVSALNLTVTNVRLNSFIGGSPSTLTVNGSNVSYSGSGDQTQVVAVNGQLNSIVWGYDNGNNYVYMRGIEVDLGDGSGYRLLTDGAGSPATTNGFYLDFSDNSSNAALGYDAAESNNWTPINLIHTVDTVYWPAYLYGGSQTYDGTDTTNNFQNPNNGTHLAFDGNTGTSAVTNGPGNNYIYFRPPGGFTNPSKIRIYTNNVSEFRINGTVVTTSPAATSAAQWYEVTSTLPTTVTEIALKSESSTYNARVRAFEINDQVLTVAAKNTDVLLDSPTNYDASSGNNGGNYATLNPLVYGSNVTYSYGNLTQYSTTSSWNTTTRATATIGVSSGKWYWEQTHDTHQYSYTGIVSADYWHSSYPGYDSQSCGFQTSNGAGYQGGGANIQTSGGYPHGAISGNDTLMFALDLDNQKMWIGRNGNWLNALDTGQAGDPAAGTNSHFTNLIPGRTYFPAASTYSTVTIDWNFGARPFSYPIPTGFKSLCTQNLDDPLIEDPSTAFDVVTYSGSGYPDLTNPRNQ